MVQLNEKERDCLKRALYRSESQVRKIKKEAVGLLLSSPTAFNREILACNKELDVIDELRRKLLDTD